MDMKNIKLILIPLVVLIMISCAAESDKLKAEENSNSQVEVQEVTREKQGKVMLMVKLKSALTYDELITKVNERKPEFAALPGLIQKYYIQIDDSTYGGVYIWESKKALADYKQSELASSIASAYSTIGKPSIEVMDILFPLRD